MNFKRKSRTVSMVVMFLMLSCTQQPSQNLTELQKTNKVQGAFAWLLPIIGVIGLSACGKSGTSSGLTVPSSLTSLPEITSAVGGTSSSISLHEDRAFSEFDGNPPPGGAPPAPPTGNSSLPKISGAGQPMQTLGVNANQSRAACEVDQIAEMQFGEAAKADQMLCMTEALSNALNIADGNTHYLKFTPPSGGAAPPTGKQDPNAPGAQGGPQSMEFRILEVKSSSGAISHFQVTQVNANGDIQYLDETIDSSGNTTITAAGNFGSASSFQGKHREVVTGTVTTDSSGNTSWSKKTLTGYGVFSSPFQTNTQTITIQQLSNLLSMSGWRSGQFTVNGSTNSNTEQIVAEMAFSGTDATNYAFGYGSANFAVTFGNFSMTGVRSWDDNNLPVNPASGGQLYSAVASTTLPTVNASLVQSTVALSSTETWDGQTLPSGASWDTIDPGKAFGGDPSKRTAFQACGTKFYFPPSNTPCNQNN